MKDMRKKPIQRGQGINSTHKNCGGTILLDPNKDFHTQNIFCEKCGWQGSISSVVDAKEINWLWLATTDTYKEN